jgi:hypothetical protein
MATWPRWEFHLHRSFRFRLERHSTEGLMMWTEVRLGWMSLKYWHLPSNGTSGVRDFFAPCDVYQPGLPRWWNGCGGDGHYLCHGCARFRDPGRDGDDA